MRIQGFLLRALITGTLLLGAALGGGWKWGGAFPEARPSFPGLRAGSCTTRLASPSGRGPRRLTGLGGDPPEQPAVDVVGEAWDPVQVTQERRVAEPRDRL